MSQSMLDTVEQRCATNAERDHVMRQEAVRLMREEIGLHHYTEAQAQLPKLEAWMATEIQPFLSRLSALAAQGKTPLPQYVVAWFRELHTVCALVPATVRRGLAEWQSLTPPIWIDGHSIDINARACMVSQIRTALMNWNGVQSRLETLRTQIEQYIHESGWPAVAT